MTIASPIPEGACCERCGEHPAHTIYAPGGALEASHGHFSVECSCCVLKDQLDFCEQQAAYIPELRRLLALGCEGAHTES